MYGSVTCRAFSVAGVWMTRGYYTVILRAGAPVQTSVRPADQTETTNI